MARMLEPLLGISIQQRGKQAWWSVTGGIEYWLEHSVFYEVQGSTRISKKVTKSVSSRIIISVIHLTCVTSRSSASC